MKENVRRGLLLSLIPLLVLVVLLQRQIDPGRKQYEGSARTGQTIGQMPVEFLFAGLTGFREAAAGLLWVRADEFFHSGNYDAILPLVRMITWLDPQQTDVYATGAWHLAYNFTDTDQRSDRRYIPPAVALLREGVNNNPNIYELYFELGWTNFHKIRNYPEAVNWLHQAMQVNRTQEGGPFPTARRNVLAHAYEKSGLTGRSIAQWEENRRVAEEALKERPNDFSAQAVAHVARKNWEMTNVRQVDRQTLFSSGMPPYDIKLEVTAEWVEPRVLDVRGTTSLPDGARVDVVLTDADFEWQDQEEFDFELGEMENVTIMIDSLSVRNNRFGRKIDMSKDPKIYNFKAPHYKLVVSYNPRTSPAYIQDRFGWNGEGMTDRNLRVVQPDRDLRIYRAGTNGVEAIEVVPRSEFPPLRIAEKTISFTREDVLKL